MNAKELKSFDRVAAIYDETRSAPPNIAAAVTRALLDALREMAPSPRLLEVGIGTGRIAVPLAEAGVRVTGMDISPGMLSVLRGKRRDIDVMLAEAAHPPLRDASFDAALFVHILHLVPDADATISATLPLLRAGAIVLHGGGDDQVVQNRVDEIITAAKREIAGVDDEARDAEANARRDRLMGAIEDLGGSIERKRVASWTHTTTVREMLERQAARAYSSSWSISESANEAFIARLREDLSDLPGGLASEVRHDQTFVLTIGRLP